MADAADRDARLSRPPLTPPPLTRQGAWAILTEFTKGDSLRKHARAVEAAMRAYAGRYGEDAEAWGIAGLLHDFDYEMHPRAPHHPLKGAEILAIRGVPAPLVYAIVAHADYAGLPRRSRLDRALYACDELSGFVHACGLVRPTGLEGLEPKSVRKKLKQPSFAAGVHRDEVYAGAELLGLELDDHIANVIASLQPIAAELGLRTAPDAA